MVTNYPKSDVVWPPDVKPKADRRPAGRPKGIIDHRQMLLAMDAMIDEFARIRAMMQQFIKEGK